MYLKSSKRYYFIFPNSLLRVVWLSLIAYNRHESGWQVVKTLVKKFLPWTYRTEIKYTADTIGDGHRGT